MNREMQFPRHEQIDDVPRIQSEWHSLHSVYNIFPNGYHVEGFRILPAQSEETMFGSWFCIFFVAFCFAVTLSCCNYLPNFLYKTTLLTLFWVPKTATLLDTLF